MLMDMKLALDVQISKQAQHELRKFGFEIVYRAGAGVDDETWVLNAIGAGANIFVSPDLDIPNLLERLGTEAAWIDVPQGMRGENQANYIAGRLTRLGANRVISSPDYKLIRTERYDYLVNVNDIDKFLTTWSEEKRMEICFWRVKGNSLTPGSDKTRKKA